MVKAMARAQRLFEAAIVGHRVGFAHGERGHAVAIHERERLGSAAEIAVGALHREKILQAMLHIASVGAVAMRVAAAQQREQREAGDGRVGF